MPDGLLLPIVGTGQILGGLTGQLTQPAIDFVNDKLDEYKAAYHDWMIHWLPLIVIIALIIMLIVFILVAAKVKFLWMIK